MTNITVSTITTRACNPHKRHSTSTALNEMGKIKMYPSVKYKSLNLLWLCGFLHHFHTQNTNYSHKFYRVQLPVSCLSSASAACWKINPKYCDYTELSRKQNNYPKIQCLKLKGVLYHLHIKCEGQHCNVSITKNYIIIIIIIIGIQPLGRSGQRPEFSQATGMALVRYILGKFLGVVCHCFPPLF